MSWRDHPLCAPRDAMPARFWGPERLDPEAWRELASVLAPDTEIAALLAALDGATDVVDVGGGTGLITQAIAARMPVVVVEPAPEQRAHLPAGITALAGRAESIPLDDGAADAAIATWVLQYRDDPMRAVSELARAARRRVAIAQAAPGNELVEVYEPRGGDRRVPTGAPRLAARPCGRDPRSRRLPGGRTLERVAIATLESRPRSPTRSPACTSRGIRIVRRWPPRPRRGSPIGSRHPARSPTTASCCVLRGAMRPDDVVRGGLTPCRNSREPGAEGSP
jgi:SAM-dependent methyltransferase